tara:strand:- start:727 stop:981 length:255 start_codon:yes stop_codon:yes gene_type:complete
MERSEHSRTPLNEGDFMRLLMQHEPALRAFARSLLPNWTLVDPDSTRGATTRGANLWFSQLQRSGVNVDSFGESTGVIDELFAG